MNVVIEPMKAEGVKRVIARSRSLDQIVEKSLDACMFISQHIYIGTVDEKLACVWGLIPPSLLSDRAYLWLYTTELVDEHKFIFIRHSQRQLERMLDEYPTIIGNVYPSNDRGKRWLRWLGAQFDEPIGQRQNFVIRRRLNG